MSAGRSLLCRTTARARAARRGCATPGHLHASMQVRQSVLLAACPAGFVKAHSRGPGCAVKKLQLKIAASRP